VKPIAWLLLCLLAAPLAGCGGGESYDAPDPAPETSQFESGAEAGADTSGGAQGSDDGQAVSDN
jgi:hypothetical protein